MNYKGMDKDMKCRGFQYEVGGEYETDEAKACECGFHACEHPLDVFNYYPPAGSRFFEVEQSGNLSKSGEDTKVASTKIKIGAELSVAGMVKAAVEYTKDRCTQNEGDKATGYRGAASATGNQGAASATGYQGAASATGKLSVAMACGVKGKAMGSLGCALFLVERGDYDGETFPIVSVKAVIVDGENVKPGVWYTLRDGDLVEAVEAEEVR